MAAIQFIDVAHVMKMLTV